MLRRPLLAAAMLFAARPVLADPRLRVVATFSILGYDPETGEVGGAVQSRVFSVGTGVLWAEADVGVVATQAIVDVSYGPQSLALLKKEMKPEDVVKKGDHLKVKLLEVDERGRMRLSRKALIEKN